MHSRSSLASMVIGVIDKVLCFGVSKVSRRKGYPLLLLTFVCGWRMGRKFRPRRLTAQWKAAEVLARGDKRYTREGGSLISSVIDSLRSLD